MIRPTCDATLMLLLGGIERRMVQNFEEFSPELEIRRPLLRCS